jgi:magnesium chelatase family protein
LRGDRPLVQARPFRAPHHTISQAGLVGGGSTPKPGEISMAHRGVLFIDEIVEMAPKTLEVLRQPIEDKIVTISRAQGSMTFPANFLLVAAMNPCPCGYYGDNTRACTCSPTTITRYQGRLSGPLLDRIDLHVDVPRVEYDRLMSDERAETSATVRQRVENARDHQRKRFEGRAGLYANADMGVSEIQQLCYLSPEAKQVLEISTKRMQLSARSYHRVIKLSRTIADLEDSRRIEVNHVAESLQYRPRQQAN